MDLEDEVPLIHQPFLKIIPLKLEESKRQIKIMLEKSVIILSASPCGAPILLVPKKDGSLLFCINYYCLINKPVKRIPQSSTDRII